MKLSNLTEAHATVVAAVLAALVAAITYACTEQAKLEAESYMQREARYQQLMARATAFYATSTDLKARSEFLTEWDQCWLYCPDGVLRAGYEFVDAIKEGNKATDEDRHLLLGKFVVAMRKDLLARKRVDETTMKPEEYQALYAKPVAGGPVR